MLKIIFIDQETQKYCYYSTLDQSVHKRLYHDLPNQKKIDTVGIPSTMQCPQQNYSNPSFVENQVTQRLNYFKRKVTDTDFQQILSFVREKFGVEARMKYTMLEEVPWQEQKQLRRKQFIEHKQELLKILTKPLSKIYIDSKSVSAHSKKSVQQEQCGLIEQIQKAQKSNTPSQVTTQSKTVQKALFQVIDQSRKIRTSRKHGFCQNEAKSIKKIMKRSSLQHSDESNLDSLFGLFLAALLLLAVGMAMICLDRDLKKQFWQFLI